MPRWASSTPSGGRFRGASKTSWPCPAPISISRCIPRSLPTAASVRSADPHRGYAPHGRGRHLRALEVQRGPFGSGRGRPPHDVAPAVGRVAAGSQRSVRLPIDAENRSLSRRRVRLHSQRQAHSRFPAAPRRSISPTPFIPRSGSAARAQRSKAASFPSSTSCRTATSSRSARGRTLIRVRLAVVRQDIAGAKQDQAVAQCQRRRKAEEIGVKLLEKEARRVKVSLKSASSQRLTEVCREYGCSSLADLHVLLGYGRHSARQVAAKLFPDHSGGEPAAARRWSARPRPQCRPGTPMRWS